MTAIEVAESLMELADLSPKTLRALMKNVGMVAV
jgi:hypothetical protein